MQDDLRLPQLATGSHNRGSEYMCVMNAMSYLNGDQEITDFPDCVDPMLARVAQLYNDTKCRHLADRKVHNGYGVETVSVLCSRCAHDVWMFGAEIMGTGGRWRNEESRIGRLGLAVEQWAVWLAVLERVGLMSLMARGEAKTLFLRLLDLMRRMDINRVVAMIDLINTAHGAGSTSKAQRDVLHGMATQLAIPMHNVVEPPSRDVWPNPAPTMREIAGNTASLCCKMALARGHRAELWPRTMHRLWMAESGYTGTPLVITPQTGDEIRAKMKVTV